jgi:YCII-related domain
LPERISERAGRPLDRPGRRHHDDSDGKPTMIDGPFETREVITGFWIIDVTSQGEAIRWALRIPCLADGEAIEIRPVYDATEFPEEMLSPGLGTRERLLRDQAAKASLS